MHLASLPTRTADWKRRCGRLAATVLMSMSAAMPALAGSFAVEEATISDIHAAIRSGKTTCREVVQAYVQRARAYNGVCARLVTADGKPVAAATGAVRAGAPLQFPTDTVSASSFLPQIDQYSGLPLDLGRMEPTASDPSVVQQYGMVAGVSKAGQLNALETLNLRGERAVACKAECDAASGPLPAHCPAACDSFRKQPDALERAAELDAQYGRNPDLKKLPLYCVVTTVKDWYDVRDMRSTAGNDVAFAMDAAPRDSTVVARMRDKGAIIYAVTIAAEGGYTRNDGPEKAKRTFVGGGGAIRSSWAGHVCNPYDTQRSAGPSSGGAGVSVGANLATVAVCETTGGSCREPANQNAVTSIVTTKGLMSEYGTSTAQFANHRPGILARTLADGVRVLDAVMGENKEPYDSLDVFTGVPKALVAAAPYASFVSNAAQGDNKGDKPLRGVRVGIVREYMVRHTPNDAAISDRVDAEIKAVLRDKLGAEIVESVDPQYPDDPAVPNMRYTFQDALSEVVPFLAPEYFSQMEGGKPEFEVAGYDVRSQDYQLQLSMRKAPLSPRLNMRRILSGLEDGNLNSFSMAKYLAERGDAKVRTQADYAAHSKWRSDAQAAGARNGGLDDFSKVRDGGSGVDRIKMREVFRMAVERVRRENHIDVFVHPNVGVPQWKIGIDREPTVDERRAAGPSVTDLLGSPEVIVPAGFDDTVYEPRYVLSEDHKRYTLVTGTERSKMNAPMPFSINFWSMPGEEPAVLRIAAAYEAATHHRKPPADFGPLARTVAAR